MTDLSGYAYFVKIPWAILVSVYSCMCLYISCSALFYMYILDQ